MNLEEVEMRIWQMDSASIVRWMEKKQNIARLSLMKQDLIRIIRKKPRLLFQAQKQRNKALSELRSTGPTTKLTTISVESIQGPELLLLSVLLQ